MRKITWNTGRKYTAEGQVIEAAVLETGEVLFRDTSRMIYGTVGNPAPDLITRDCDLRRYVMRLYDNGMYNYSGLAGARNGPFGP